MPWSCEFCGHPYPQPYEAEAGKAFELWSGEKMIRLRHWTEGMFGALSCPACESTNWPPGKNGRREKSDFRRMWT